MKKKKFRTIVPDFSTPPISSDTGLEAKSEKKKDKKKGKGKGEDKGE